MPPRTTLITEALAPDAYAMLLRSADIVLVPYHCDIYEARTSGVFLEASALGKVVIATSGTWMGDFIAAYGHGLLVRDRSVPDLARALRDLSAAHGALLARARSAAVALRAVHNPDNLLDHVLGQAGASAEPPHPRRAAIFYPWGDIAKRTGAAARTRLLAKYLAGKGREVRIIYLGDEDIALAPGVMAEGCRLDPSRWDALRAQISALAGTATNQATDGSHHLYLHLWSRLDDDFKLCCLRAIRWADEIFVEYTYFAEVITQICAAENKTFVMTLHDLLSQIVRGSEPLYSLTRAVEIAALRTTERLVISNAQEGALCEAEGFPVTVIPHPFDVDALRSHDDDIVQGVLTQILGISLTGRPVCLFVGSGYGPNREAALEVRRLAEGAAADPRLGAVIFVVAGEAHAVCNTENFFALGRVEDTALDALYQVATIVLAPLLTGSGMSVKIVEALARGSALVSTSIGVRGYPVVDGEHCVIEDDLGRYADRIAALIA